jgi:hypothetical protein
MDPRRWRLRPRPEGAPAWSPAPIIGFRHWTIDLDSLRGATGTRWHTPVLSARCRRSGDRTTAVPHTSGECGPQGCGIYAAKDPGPLRIHLRPQAWPIANNRLMMSAAFGAVALTGRVIEHDHGYRAAHAGAVGMVVVTQVWLSVHTDPAGVAFLFADPVEALTRAERNRIDDPDTAWPVIADTLRFIARTEEARWT